MPLEIRLNPADKTAVAENLSDERRRAELVPDATVVRGGCHVSRGHACVDATIDQQCQTLIEQLVTVDQSASTDAQLTTPLDPDRISAIADRFAPGENNGD